MWLRRKTIPDTIPKLRLRTYAPMKTTMTDGCARRNTTWLRPVVTSYNTTQKQFNISTLITTIFNSYASPPSLLLHSMHILSPHPFLSQFLSLENPRHYFPYVGYPFTQSRIWQDDTRHTYNNNTSSSTLHYWRQHFHHHNNKLSFTTPIWSFIL